MVAFLGLLEQSQILVEQLLLRERDSIYTRHLRTLLIATPVGRARAQHLESLDWSRTHQVRTTTQVSKRTLSIRSDMSVFKVSNQFVLVRLPH